MQYGHAGLLNGGTCQQMKPGPVVPGSGDQCATWAKLTNVTINGGGTINGNGDSGWYNKPYEEDRPVLMGAYSTALMVLYTGGRVAPLNLRFDRSLPPLAYSRSVLDRRPDDPQSDSDQSGVLDRASLLLQQYSRLRHEHYHHWTQHRRL